MPVADVNMTITLEGTPWVVNAIISVKMPGQTVRPALDGEVEVQLFDIGEIPVDRHIYHQSGWVLTFGGRVPFNVTEYPWVVGYADPILGWNRLSLSARLAGVEPEIAVVKDIKLGPNPGDYIVADWPPGFPDTGSISSRYGYGLNSTKTSLMIGGSIVAGLILLFLGSRR